jgi:transposase-like protein
VVLVEVDILGPSDRRRVWSSEDKAALLAEIDAEGGKVRLVARRHQISESLLYNWRSARKAAAVALGAPENVEFIPVGVIEDPATRGPTMLVLQLQSLRRGLRLLRAKPDQSRSRCRTAPASVSMLSSTRRRCLGCCVR